MQGSCPLKRLFAIALCWLLLVLSGCAEMPERWDPQAYTVKRGDTLYSIAWRYEKDFRDLAAWNNIQPPYAIFPGQRLQMQAANRDGTVLSAERPQLLIESKTGLAVDEAQLQQEESVTEVPEALYVVVEKGDTLYSISRKQGLSHHQLARWNHLRSPYLVKPGQKLRLRPPAAALGQSASEPPQAATKPVRKNVITATPIQPSISKAPTISQPPALPRKVDRWLWPVEGRVVTTFRAKDTSRKGIKIAGKLGQEVRASAGGTVVYSGNGLINYGNLVIIKHSHSFLSAYAHNQSLLVKEGDAVKAGQAIARMGRLHREKPRLHFEIRRNGKPVNPLHYLPKG